MRAKFCHKLPYKRAYDTGKETFPFNIEKSAVESTTTVLPLSYAYSIVEKRCYRETRRKNMTKRERKPEPMIRMVMYVDDTLEVLNHKKYKLRFEYLYNVLSKNNPTMHKYYKYLFESNLDINAKHYCMATGANYEEIHKYLHMFFDDYEPQQKFN